MDPKCNDKCPYKRQKRKDKRTEEKEMCRQRHDSHLGLEEERKDSLREPPGRVALLTP